MHTQPRDEAANPAQYAVLASTLAHLASYLQSGCSRSLHIARLLLKRLDEDSAADVDVQAFCHVLEETFVTARAASRPK